MKLLSWRPAASRHTLLSFEHMCWTWCWSVDALRAAAPQQLADWSGDSPAIRPPREVKDAPPCCALPTRVRKPVDGAFLGAGCPAVSANGTHIDAPKRRQG